LNHIEYSENSKNGYFSPYIKASSQIRRLLNEKEMNNFALVFPYSQDIVNQFVTFEVLRAIIDDEIHCNYDFSNFIVKEKVSIGKATAIFEGILNNKICLTCSDLTVHLPKEIAPVLQKTNSKQLSKFDTFQKERNKIFSSSDVLSTVANKKSHMDKTIVFVNLDSTMNEIITSFSSIYLNEKSLKDLIYITKLVKGKPENVFSVVDNGISPLLCTSDLMDFDYSDIRGHIHSVIIKYSKKLEENVFFLQSLSLLQVPVTVILDEKDYVESSIFNGFKTWVWDKDNVSIAKFSPSQIINYPYLYNCARVQMSYRILECNLIDESFNLITESFKILNKEPDSIEHFPFISKLYQMVLDVVRCPFPNGMYVNSSVLDDLSSIESEIIDVQNFITPPVFEALKKVVENLFKIHSNNTFEYPKGNALIKIVQSLSLDRKDVYVIVPDNFSKQDCQELLRKDNEMVHVLWTEEFFDCEINSGVCIIIGWLQKRQMKNLIYSYKVEEYILLLYSGENHRWANPTSRSWRKRSSSFINRIIQNSIGLPIKLENTDSSEEITDLEQSNEESEFFKAIRLSRHHQYHVKGALNSQSVITADVSSIEFLGGSFMFVTDKHKMLVVDSTFDKVSSAYLDDIKEGDYIAIRKSSKDIIREEADRILNLNNYSNSREIASEWKELINEIVRDSAGYLPSVYEKLRSNGCTVILQTVRLWVNDPEIIMMDKKEDLNSIIMTARKKPLHTSDEIYDSGMLVREAHKNAGKSISDKLYSKLKKSKPQVGKPLDASIDLDIPDIGEVSLLRVVDVSREKETVETKFINKLLS